MSFRIIKVQADLLLSATSGNEHKLLKYPALGLHVRKLSLNAKKMIDNLSFENNLSRLIPDRIFVKVKNYSEQQIDYLIFRFVP